MVGRILPPFSFILPLWLSEPWWTGNAHGKSGPALLVSGASFAAMQFYWSNFQESGLVDIIASIFSLLVMVAFLKMWKPRALMLVPSAEVSIQARRHSPVVVLKAWSPFVLSSIFIFVCGMPSLNKYLQIAALNFSMPGLHNAVIRVPPVVPAATPEARHGRSEHLCTPGHRRFLSGPSSQRFCSGCQSPGFSNSFGGLFGNSDHRFSPSALWSAWHSLLGTRAWTPSWD
jgi:hypothetical protein